MLDRVIETGEGIIVSDTRGDERFVQFGASVRVRSLVVAPILGNNQRLGTLSVLGDAPDLFSAADQRLLEKICLQVAAAIGNARLLESERQAAGPGSSTDGYRRPAQSNLVHG